MKIISENRFSGKTYYYRIASRTLSLLSFITVSEMLLPKSALSPELRKLLGNFPAVRKTETKFPGAQRAVEAFVESGYYTLLGVQSWVRFCKQEFGDFPRLVGRFYSYLLQARGTPQILVDKTSPMTRRLIVYKTSKCAG